MTLPKDPSAKDLSQENPPQGKPLKLTNPTVLIAVLFFVNIINYMDRMILSVLLVPIKSEFELTDTQVGLVTGFAFAIFYGAAGLVVARLADRMDRVKLIAAALGFWSLMTAATGMAQGFFQLLLARIGVGTGEAGAVPSSFALISDYFPLERRAAPMAIFSAGATVGTIVGMAAGGFIASLWGWRVAFYVAAIPGLVLVPVVLWLLRDAPRGYSDQHLKPSADMVRGGLAALIQDAVYLRFAIGASLFSLVLFGISTWMPAYLVRKFDLGLDSVGLYLALGVGLGGGIGMVIGGFLANYLSRMDIRWLCWLPCLASFSSLPFYYGAVYADAVPILIGCLFMATVVGGLSYGSVATASLAVVDAGLRARAAALATAFGSLIGIGGGPLLVGVISDLARPKIGDVGGLQLGLTICVSGMGVAAILFWGAVNGLYARLGKPVAVEGPAHG